MGFFDFLKKMWTAKPQSTTGTYADTDSGSGNTDFSSSYGNSADNNSETENFKGQGGEFDGGGSSDSWDNSFDSLDSGDSGDSGGDGGGDGGD
ncbi:MAG: hypothetical protein ACK5OS_17150 [Chryseotalea sp.]|jgi:hypothetical protein